MKDSLIDTMPGKIGSQSHQLEDFMNKLFNIMLDFLRDPDAFFLSIQKRKDKA